MRIEFGGDPVEVLLVDQPAFEEIRKASGTAKRVFRRRWKTEQIVAWSAGALTIALGLCVWGASRLAGWMATRVPPAWEVAMGQGVADRLVRDERVCGDATSAAELRTVLDRLVAAGPPAPYAFRVMVVRDTGVNAFAAPGGFVVVNSGLLEAARTPDELAGVLAHEIQHVTLRHSTRAILREVPMRLALASLSGGTGIESAAGAVASLGSLRYLRADEAEADREGMRLLIAARVDASGMVSFMRTLEAKHEDVPRFARYLSSHPRTADRIAELEALAKESRYEPQPLLDSAAWGRLRGMCDRAESRLERV
jgi:predicted Zn-dependent protease